MDGHGLGSSSDSDFGDLSQLFPEVANEFPAVGQSGNGTPYEPYEPAAIEPAAKKRRKGKMPASDHDYSKSADHGKNNTCSRCGLDRVLETGHPGSNLGWCPNEPVASGEHGESGPSGPAVQSFSLRSSAGAKNPSAGSRLVELHTQADSMAGLADRDALALLALVEGADQAHPAVAVAAANPRPNRFAALLDGRSGRPELLLMKVPSEHRGKNGQSKWRYSLAAHAVHFMPPGAADGSPHIMLWAELLEMYARCVHIGSGRVVPRARASRVSCAHPRACA